MALQDNITLRGRSLSILDLTKAKKKNKKHEIPKKNRSRKSRKKLRIHQLEHKRVSAESLHGGPGELEKRRKGAESARPAQEKKKRANRARAAPKYQKEENHVFYPDSVHY